jgi:hypothetical protein
VKEDWEVPQVDIKGAYLNAKLPEKIHMKLLHNYLKPEEKGKVCCLLKGLYRVKQAGHEWYKELSGTFIKLRFTRSEADHSVFYIHSEKPIIVTVSTDDMTLAVKFLGTIQQLKGDLQQRYEITDLGELHWLLGIEFRCDRAACTISLSQKAYIDSILKEFNLEDAVPLSVPAEPGAVLGKHQSPKTTQELKDMENIPYA